MKLVFLILLVATLQADPILFLTWKKDPSKTMTCVWIAEEPSAIQGIIEWKTPEESQFKQKAVIKTLVTTCDKQFYVCQAELPFLKPDTLYQFKIEKLETLHSFKTAPKLLEKPVKFIVGGDVYHDEISAVETMMKAAAGFNPLFCIIGGDIAYAFPSKKNDLEETKRWFTFLSIYEKEMVTPDGCMIPLIPVLGNHDICGGYLAGVRNARFFFSVFPMPGQLGYATLDFGNWLSLFLLDSGHANPVNGAQSFWLQKTLESKKEFDYIFAIYHVGAYPSYRAFGGKRPTELRKFWTPIFDQYSITAAFEHHDHTLKRTHPIKNNCINKDGVIYLGDGSFGITHPRKPHPKDLVWYLANSAQVQSVWAVTLNPSEAYFEALSSAGTVVDKTTKKSRKKPSNN